ncbi:MAG UNVERIFIED_CONTAM: FAD-dependent oxidoreductase [Planctomycetaceae bacterium]|jgi:phytoene dehydrogenase-like protein
MTTISACYDAIVIGSGHNGLTAACCLAAAGQQVLVLERQTEFGGATTSQRVFPDHDAWLSRYSYLVSLFPTKLQQLLRLNFRTLQAQHRFVHSMDRPQRTASGTCDFQFRSRAIASVA